MELNLAGAFNAEARVGEVGGFSRARTGGPRASIAVLNVVSEAIKCV